MRARCRVFTTVDDDKTSEEAMNTKSEDVTVRIRKLAAVQPHNDRVAHGYTFGDAAVMKMLERGDKGVIDDVTELVDLIRSVRDLFGAAPERANPDEAWTMATTRYQREFGMPHRFLAVPTLRKVFGAILVDVLRGVERSRQAA